MATLENVFSTWGNSRVQLFHSTCWCISLSLVAFGHSWYGEMHQRVLWKSWTLELPHVEKLHLLILAWEHFAFSMMVVQKKSCVVPNGGTNLVFQLYNDMYVTKSDLNCLATHFNKQRWSAGTRVIYRTRPVTYFKVWKF